MTYRELAEWASKKDSNEQTIVAVEESERPDEFLEEVGSVWYAPFVGATLQERTIKSKLYPKVSELFIELWDDEVNRKMNEPYTWGDLIKWIAEIDSPDDEVFGLAGYHGCHFKFLKNDMLYAYGVN